jgi:cellulose synthase/poly-beta-1,6-N-acetylglucosamine synthase-like glycosyltransferase
MSDVTVLIPYHIGRENSPLLARAISSVGSQSYPCEMILAKDVHAMGAAITRNHGLALVTTPWVAFLDSDDELDPDHIEKLVRCAEETGADYVYPWFRVVGGSDPFPMFFGMPWDNDAPHCTTVTILVRTEIAQRLGFLDVPQEDWNFTLRCVATGVKIVHLPERTWTWYHHGKNTSGRAGHGDA